MRRAVSLGIATLATVAVAGASTPAPAGKAPNWKLDLRLARWVAPSSYEATVVRQTAGLKVRLGLPVTLVLDRRTRCSVIAPGAAPVRILCRMLRARVAGAPLRAAASGQFETGSLGRIGFRARIVQIRS